MSNKARIAVIGTGWWATDYHIPGLQANPDAEIAAICDKNPTRLQKAAEAYNISRTYTDYLEMLSKEEIDGAIVATPHATHYPIARDCIERGLHLVIEKPMTLHAWEANDLVQRAKEKGKEILICYPYQYSPQSQRAREVVRSGELGEIHYVINSFNSDMTRFLGGQVSDENPPTRFKIQGPSEAYNSPEMMGGGHGQLQMTHGIGMMFFVTGLRARTVHAIMKNHGNKLDMVDVMSVEFENGALGTLGGSGLSRAGSGVLLSVFCTEGCFVADSIARAFIVQRKDGSREDLAQQGYWGARYAVPNNFVGVILGREPNSSPGENGVRVVEVLDAAYRSARENGRAVQIEELYQAEGKVNTETSRGRS